MRRTLLVATLFASLTLAGAARADAPTPLPMSLLPAPHHHVYGSLLGGFGFMRANVGPFSLGYEWVVDAHWGLLVEAHYLHFHGAPLHVNLLGGAIGVRYHVNGSRTSPFVGLVAGYHYGIGYTHDEATHTQLDLVAEQPFVMVHAGYRWTFAWGLEVAVRIGLGYGEFRVSDKNGSTTQQPVTAAREALGFTPLAIDAELSVGYGF